MKICFFTATGNSLYVARRLGGELLSIPQLLKNNELDIKDDVVGIVCPVYAGQMPMMVKSFIEKVKIKADYTFMVYTFGMSESVARSNAVSIMVNAEKRLDYVNTVKMVDNYLPGFEMKNQIETVGEKKIEEHIDKVREEISARTKNTKMPGIANKLAMSLVRNTMGKVIFKKTAARSYVVTDDCIACGICAKVCPADNITVTDKPLFADQCESCYACIHNCPQNALHLKHERSAVRFRNENVSVKDIIEANL